MRVLYEDAESERIRPGTSFVPYANAPLASLSFHSHRDAVRFFVCAPTRSNPTPHRRTSTADSPAHVEPKSERMAAATTDGWLLVSGGEGYIDVRHGEPEPEVQESQTGASESELDDERWKQRVLTSKQEHSHLIVWQLVVT